MPSGIWELSGNLRLFPVRFPVLDPGRDRERIENRFRLKLDPADCDLKECPDDRRLCISSWAWLFFLIDLPLIMVHTYAY